MSTVIVAIPSDMDHVWKISSEKIPHLTLLFLGDQQPGPEIAHIAEFLEHATNTSLSRFGLDVDRRGVLGSEEADVLFFSKYNRKRLDDFRAQLLQNEAIARAYNSAEQYPEWIPHLTLGYPDAPAKADVREYPQINWVDFDRIALWTGDFEGPEFRLNDMELSMSDVKKGANVVEDVLKHYGVKGMKWGVRKSDKSPTPVEVKVVPGRKIVTKGGKFQPVSDDALKTATSRQKARSSSTDSLSNSELQALVKRMQLEQQYIQLSTQRKSVGARFVSKLLGQTAQQQAQRVANTYAAQQVDEMMKKAK